MSRLREGKDLAIRMQDLEQTIQLENTRYLPDDQFAQHTHSLASSLRIASRVAHEEESFAGSNTDFKTYLIRLADTMDLLLERYDLVRIQPNGDIAQEGGIDPTESGYPLFLRDLRQLQKEKKRADAHLAALPGDAQIMEGAIFSICRGNYPAGLVFAQRQKKYFADLKDLELPEKTLIHPAVYIGEKGDFHFHRKSVEVMDNHANIPRMYTVYYRVPNLSMSKADLESQLDEAIDRGLHSVASYTLPSVARYAEEIPGIQVDQIEKFEVGPFYTKLTVNDEDIDGLLGHANGDGSIFLLRKYTIQRAQERKRDGISGWFTSFMTGDSRKGTFTQQFQHPQLAIMPHRMIQAMYNNDLHFDRETKTHSR